eukprot:m.1630693 g.1630693  ORF g.1630693 m.1630693 type:complete len:2102 (-) comp25399_c0_seq4:3442-9747(-)
MAATKKKGVSENDAIDYDDRMLEVSEDVASISTYLQEGFWPQWVNVFSDFGVSVNYFIDGDALLVQCFEDPLLDWEHGGQPAHVIYRFLKFVAQVRERHATSFRILFFSDLAKFWTGSKRVVRDALIRYIKNVTDMQIMDTMESLWSEGFVALTHLQQPAYIISKRDFATEHIPQIDPMLYLHLEALVLTSLNKNQSVVLLDKALSFEGPRMHAWVLLERPPDASTARLLAAAHATLDGAATTDPVVPVAVPEPVSFGCGRVKVAVAAVQRMVAGGTVPAGSVTEELCAAFVAHVVLLASFPPSRRAAVVPDAAPITDLACVQQLPAFVEALAVHLLGVVQTMPSLAADEALVCDLWDGRFLLRLMVAARATSATSLGLTAEGDATLTQALAACGLGHCAVVKPATDATAAAACTEFATISAERAKEMSTFPDDSRPLPRYASEFLSRVAPDVVTMYGGATVSGADGTSTTDVNTSAATPAVDSTTKNASTESEEEVKDNWDDDDDDVKDDWDDSDGDDDNANDASVAANDVTTTPDGSDAAAPGATAAPTFGSTQLRLPDITPSWAALDALPEEVDAYNSEKQRRFGTVDVRQVRALGALRHFTSKLRQRLRGRLLERDLESEFQKLLTELRASEQDGCAKDLEAFHKTNRFGGGLERLIVRKWQGRMKPQRNEQVTIVSVRDYAKSLQDRVVQQEVIIENDDTSAKAAKTSVKSAMLSAKESIKKMVAVSEKRRKDLDDVLDKAARDTKKGRFADAWMKFDDFVIDRCNKDKLLYNSTARVIKNLTARLPDAKPKSGGSKGKGGKKGGGKGASGADGASDLDDITKQYNAALEAIAAHNCIVLASAARLSTTFSWWLEQYASKRTTVGESGIGESTDAIENEQWACGKVLAEVFKVINMAKTKEQLPKDMAVDMATYMKRLGFPAEAELLLTENGVPAEAQTAVTKDVAVVVDRHGKTLAEFQMACMGPLLLRPRGQPDERVRRFNPDEWQKDLLDAVDTTEDWRRKCKELMKKTKGLTLQEASDKVREAHNGLSATSVLVSAPTSSGKTFISFYVMEQVLREASLGEGVVVYVAPNKALVHQVEADLYARFEKPFQRHSHARSLHGIFTKEYRTNVHDCQVLITVPECLELLLVMAIHAKWAQRIRWIIFDEVHCISKEKGAVWERLLVATEAPYIALSATIGNPEDFAEWLKEVEGAKNRKLQLVEHHDRINDLAMYIYNSKAQSTGGTMRATDCIVSMNPLGVVSTQLVKSLGYVPKQTKLLPEHCWEVVNVVGDLAGDTGDATLAAMLKELDFTRKPQTKALSMEDSTNIEKKIKKMFTHIVQTNEALASQILQRLNTQVNAIMDEQESASATDPFAYLEANLLSCLLALDAAGGGSEENSELKRLPAIVFHLTARGCNKLAQQLLTSLENRQNAAQARNFCRILTGDARCEQLKLMGVESDIVYRIRATEVDEYQVDDASLRLAVEMSKESQDLTMAQVREFLVVDKATDWAKPLEATTEALFRHIVRAKEKYAAAVVLRCTQENERRVRDYNAEVEAIRDSNEHPAPPEHVNFDHLLPSFIDKTYSFLPPGQPVSNDDLKEHLGRWYDPSDFRTKALQRGFGVHYGELPRKYKNAVERLLRLRKLKVVIATSTLAMGINMPCKTVVIAGDEPHLNSLEFHQMIGRAGRRTFDNRGNVVFLGTPPRKIARLLSTPVADLVGNVPLTPGLAMRMFLRYHDSKSNYDREKSVQMMRNIVYHPFSKLGGSGHQVAHQLVFCLDLLMDDVFGFLRPVVGPKGSPNIEPSSMCTFLSHLYYLEPFNFPLIVLLSRGIFDDLLNEDTVDASASELDSNQARERRNAKLLHVMAWLFHPKALPVRMRGCASTATSDMRLPPLPPAFLKTLTTYNAIILDRFSSYMRRYAVTACGVENIDVLPATLDKYRLALDSPAAVDTNEASVTHVLAAGACTIVARSPFVATSGHPDVFTSLHDLLNSLRDGMYLDRSLVPTLPEIDGAVNSFLVDFFNTGLVDELSSKNGLRHFKLYDEMDDFTYTLRVIKESLARRMNFSDDSGAEGNQTLGNADDSKLATLQGFDELEEAYAAKFGNVFLFGTRE